MVRIEVQLGLRWVRAPPPQGLELEKKRKIKNKLVLLRHIKFFCEKKIICTKIVKIKNIQNGNTDFLVIIVQKIVPKCYKNQHAMFEIMK